MSGCIPVRRRLPLLQTVVCGTTAVESPTKQRDVSCASACLHVGQLASFLKAPLLYYPYVPHTLITYRLGSIFHDLFFPSHRLKPDLTTRSLHTDEVNSVVSLQDTQDIKSAFDADHSAGGHVDVVRTEHLPPLARTRYAQLADIDVVEPSDCCFFDTEFALHKAAAEG